MCSKEELEKKNDELTDKIYDLEVDLDTLKEEYEKLSAKFIEAQEALDDIINVVKNAQTKIK